MKMSETMRGITNKVVKEKEAKEMEKINELYNTVLSKIEYEARQGKSTAVIRHQGFYNEKIIEMLEADGFSISKTRLLDTCVKW